ncbi:MAG: hypothetical protein ACO2PN_14755 [Pyrobaculum sp.]
MRWMRKYPYYHILEKQKREIEELEKRKKEEERRAWKAAREKFRDVVSAEKRYKKDLEADIYEITIWDALKIHGGKPLFRDLWHMAEHCTDARSCYRMLVHFRLGGRESDLELAREALKTGVDVEMVIALLYNGKREEAVKLVKR